MDISKILSIPFLANQNKATQLLVCIIVALIVAILGTFAGWKVFGIVEGIEIQKVQETERLKTLETRYEAQMQSEQIAEEIKRAESLLVKVRRKLPLELNAADFIEQLNQNAILSGIEVVSTSPLLEEKKTFYYKIPVLISGCATYDQIGQFVASLSRLERIITLDSFGMNNKETDAPSLHAGLRTVLPAGVQIPRTSKCTGAGRQEFSALIATYRFAQ